MKIKQITAREILDSRGLPTVEVDVEIESNVIGRFAVPSGASKGSHEALELRDGDAKRYKGKGVLKALSNINTVIAPNLVGSDVREQSSIDRLLIELDGTPNKSKLGANAILGVSMACARAHAQTKGMNLFASLGGHNAQQLPVPLMNVINGGAHADNELTIQEFMIAPVGAPTFKEALRYGSEIFHALKQHLNKHGFATSVGDEGGFAPNISSAQEALDIMLAATEDAGFKPGVDIYFALDVAANELYDEQHQIYKVDEKRKLNEQEMILYYSDLCKEYPIMSIEDPFIDTAMQSFSKLTAAIGSRIQIVGDDLFVTNEALLKKGISVNAANCILIKPNQVGTLTETLRTIACAQNSGYGYIISHRSGETEDTFIADLAVATQATQIKTGSLSRSERLCKYNQLLRIEEILGNNATYAGKSVLIDKR